MDYEVKEVEMEGEFKVCPACGYKDGFHSMFKKDHDITKWFFICPACHDVFDIGLTAYQDLSPTIKEGESLKKILYIVVGALILIIGLRFIFSPPQDKKDVLSPGPPICFG